MPEAMRQNVRCILRHRGHVMAQKNQHFRLFLSVITFANVFPMPLPSLFHDITGTIFNPSLRPCFFLNGWMQSRLTTFLSSSCTSKVFARIQLNPNLLRFVCFVVSYRVVELNNKACMKPLHF